MSSLRNIFAGLKDYEENLYAHPFFIELKEDMVGSRASNSHLNFARKS